MAKKKAWNKETFLATKTREQYNLYSTYAPIGALAAIAPATKCGYFIR
jgi:hypothetical protein